MLVNWYYGTTIPYESIMICDILRMNIIMVCLCCYFLLDHIGSKGLTSALEHIKVFLLLNCDCSWSEASHLGKFFQDRPLLTSFSRAIWRSMSWTIWSSMRFIMGCTKQQILWIKHNKVKACYITYTILMLGTLVPSLWSPKIFTRMSMSSGMRCDSVLVGSYLWVLTVDSATSTLKPKNPRRNMHPCFSMMWGTAIYICRIAGRWHKTSCYTGYSCTLILGLITGSNNSFGLLPLIWIWPLVLQVQVFRIHWKIYIMNWSLKSQIFLVAA